MKKQKPTPLPADVQIQYILENFDFDLVHRTMKALDWHWHAGMPTKRELQDEARRLLQQVASAGKKRWYTHCGGFSATYEKGYLFLEFIVASWDGTEYEEGDLAA